jgi:hypothetical protein
MNFEDDLSPSYLDVLLQGLRSFLVYLEDCGVLRFRINLAKK